MNDFPESKTIIEWLIGAVMALLTWFAKLQHSRLARLERTAVTREELARITSDMRSDLARMHQENRGDQQYIRERLDRMVDP